MSINYRAFVDYARQNLKASHSEISVRYAISRAYYSAYHHVFQFHASLPSPGSPSPGNYGRHELLIQQLINPTVPSQSDRLKSRSLGYILRILKGRRMKADYRLDLDIAPSEAHQTIIETDRLMS